MTNPVLPRPIARDRAFSRFLAAHRRSLLAASTFVATNVLLTACGGGGASETDATVATDQSASAILAVNAVRTLQSATTTASTTAASTVTVRASSNLVDDTGALLQLRYNGVVVATGEVRSTTPADLTFTIPVVIDGGTLDVIFTNAELPDGRHARLLTIESVQVNGKSFSPTGAGVTFDIGWGAAAFDGQQVRASATVLDSNGAMRIPMPAAAELGATRQALSSELSVDPGPYVDYASGSDSNPGTIDRPFQTLAKLTRNSVPLLPGENIHLRCGQMWHESLALTVNQLVDGTQIVPYGADCATLGKPTISGADRFTGGWTKNGNVWSRALPAGTPKITRMFVNFTPMRPAQWPNAGQAQVLLQGANGASQVTVGSADAAALAQRDLSGASAMLRTMSWNIEALQLASTGSSGGALKLAANPTYAPQAGDSLVLGDKLWMLDEPGEFYHDVDAQRLYVILLDSQAGLDLNNAIVEGSVRDVALDIRGRSNLVVRGIGVTAARQDGVRLTDAPQAHLSDLDVGQNGSAGIRLWQWTPIDASTPGPIVENSVVTGNGQYGIDANYVNGATIRANRVVDTGTGIYTGPVYAAIAAGPGAQVLDNIVDGAGYIGIRFSGLQGSTVARNDVSRYCLRLSDCGGIYTWSGPAGVSSQQSSTVENNRLHEAVAPALGSPDAGNFLVAGIYIDDHSNRVAVRGNTLAGQPVGIFLHNTSYSTVESNRIWMVDKVALWGSMDQAGADSMTGNVWRNNEIFTTVQATFPDGSLPSFKTAQAFWFWHSLDGEAAIAAGRNEFSGNVVVQAQGPVSAHAWLRGPNGERYVDAIDWQQLNKGEPQPTRAVRFDPMLTTLGPEQIIGGGFDAGLTPWRTYQNPAGSGYALQPLASLPGCTGPCMSFTAGHPYDLIASNAFSLRPGAAYLYRWTAVMPASSGAVVGPPYISRDATPFDVMADAKGFTGYIPRRGGAGETVNYESYFMAKAADPARVNVQIETIGVPVAFDSISVREIVGFSVAWPWDWAAVAFAPVGADRTIGCADLGWPAGCKAIGTTGETVSLPLTLPAGTARLLMRSDSTFRRW